MSHPDPYDAARHYHPDGGLLCTYLGRATVSACLADPTRAPSGLRWRCLTHGGWRLWRDGECVGAVIGMGPGWWTGSVLRQGVWRTIATGALRTVAREVRRG